VLQHFGGLLFVITAHFELSTKSTDTSAGLVAIHRSTKPFFDLAAGIGKGGMVCAILTKCERFRTHVQAVAALATLKVSVVRNMPCKAGRILSHLRLQGV